MKEDNKNNSDQCQNRWKWVWVQKSYKEIGAFNSCQAENPCGNSSTDICAHNKANSLGQMHDSRVYEANYHNCGCRWRLNDCSNCCTNQNCFHTVRWKVFQNLFQFTAGKLFQTVSHYLHSIKEHRQSADQCQNAKKIHYVSSPFLSL